jgi:4-hydroxymandelate oxidase
MSDSLTRREALARAGALVTGPAGALTAGQTDRRSGPPRFDPSSTRLVPRGDLVNTLEFEEQARKQLAPTAFGEIAGSDRTEFDRITLRPRMCVPVLDMNLSVTLFGDTHFAPIVVGPIEDQKRFHPDAEIGTVTGAAAAKAAIVVSSDSSVPLPDLMARAKTPVWYQIYAADPAAGVKLRSAIQAGCRAVCLTIGASPVAERAQTRTTTRVDWNSLATLVRASSVPVLVKGIATPAAATMAIARGAQGLIASSYRGARNGTDASAIAVLPEIVDAAVGKVPVLVDGSFRRGTDILKALAFGARAVLIARPVIWGLAAYGADGVQGVLEMLQTELARYMGMCGKARLDLLDHTLVKVDRRG